MRRTLLIVVALAAIVAVEIVWLAPATLVGSRIEQASASALRLADTEGTVWHARGMLVGGGARLPIAWTLELWPLLRGEARLHIAPYAGTAKGPPRAAVRLHGNGFSVRDAEVVIPAPMLAALAATPPSWMAGGDVDIAAASFNWMPPAGSGEARIVWRAARLTPPAASDAVALGDVTVALTAFEDRVKGTIRNDGGDLDVQGDVSVRPGEGTLLSLVLVPRESASPALRGALAAVGAGDGNGWRVEWRIPAR